MSDQRNLIIAIALSLAILLGFQFFWEAPRQQQQQQQQQQRAENQASQGTDGSMIPAAPSASGATGPGTAGTMPGAPAAGALPGAANAVASRDAALKQSPRVAVNGVRLGGSIALKGARIDDLTMLDYKDTIADDSPAVTLLSPRGAANPYFSQFGWVPIGELKVPDGKSLWRADRPSLTPARPLTLNWENGQGVRFIQVIEIDDAFMLTVTQRVENNSRQSISIHP
ncbi:MAG: membrane protein insertase YidC, partial [Alphaproteobacteria bacterium]|nr:membrane protein insertase YidC [Alphaproteobacteria bacterium]